MLSKIWSLPKLKCGALGCLPLYAYMHIWIYYCVTKCLYLHYISSKQPTVSEGGFVIIIMIFSPTYSTVGYEHLLLFIFITTENISYFVKRCSNNFNLSFKYWSKCHFGIHCKPILLQRVMICQPIVEDPLYFPPTICESNVVRISPLIIYTFRYF